MRDFFHGTIKADFDDLVTWISIVWEPQGELKIENVNAGHYRLNFYSRPEPDELFGQIHLLKWSDGTISIGRVFLYENPNAKPVEWFDYIGLELPTYFEVVEESQAILGERNKKIPSSIMDDLLPGRPHFEEDIEAHKLLMIEECDEKQIFDDWLIKVNKRPERKEIDPASKLRQFKRLKRPDWGLKE